MNVVITVPVWTLNGITTFAAHLARGLRGAGVPVRLLVTGVTYRDPKPLPRPAADDLPLEALPLPRVASWPARWRALRAYLESHAPCLYLPNHDVRHSGISPTLSARVGIVGIAHSDDPQHYAHVARLGRYWNATVAVSDTIATRLRQTDHTLADRLAVIPYGVSIADGDSVPARAPGPLHILYTGRLEQPQKRVLDLAEIAHALARRGVDFTLTVAGDGPAHGALRDRLTALALTDRVRLLGTVSNDVALALCAAHDVFLLPSAYEGLPLSALEAMSRGCVPVVSDVASGLPDLVRSGVNGYRVPVGDVARFADCLTTLAREPRLRARLAERARATIATEGYRAEDMTRRYLQLFETLWPEVVAGRFPRPAGPVVPPPGLGWRERLAAPLWPLRHGWRGGPR